MANGQEPCLGKMIPLPTIGSQASYSFNGYFRPLASPIIFYRQGHEGLALNESQPSVLQIEIAAPQPRMTTHGTELEMPGIAYVYDGARFMIEWLHPSHGGVMTEEFPFGGMFGSRPVHAERYGFDGYPALFGYTWLAGRAMGELPQRVTFDERVDRGQLIEKTAVTLETKSRIFRVHEGTCELEVEIQLTKTAAGKTRVVANLRMVLSESEEFPVAIQVMPPARSLELRLIDSRQGDGPGVPAYAESIPSLRGPEMSGTFHGFPSGGEGIFPTPLNRAMQALREDITTGQWLALHPNAKPVRITHNAGAPNSEVVDTWSIGWIDGTEKQLMTLTSKRQAIGLGPTFTTKMETENQLREGTVSSKSISFEQADTLVRELHGGPLEWVHCVLATLECGLGTHNETGFPRAGSGESGFALDGVRIALGQSRVIQTDKLLSP